MSLCEDTLPSNCFIRSIQQVVCADLENERKAIKSITVYLCLTVHPEKQNPKPFGLCTAKCLNPGEQAWAGSLDRALFLFSHYWPL